MKNIPLLEKVSYGLMFFALIFIIQYNFIPLLFATILTYLLIDKINHLMIKLMDFWGNKRSEVMPLKKKQTVNLISTLLISAIVITLLIMMGFSLYKYFSIDNLTMLQHKIDKILDTVKVNHQLPEFILSKLPEQIIDLKPIVIDYVKMYANEISNIGKASFHVIGYVFLGMIIGIMLSFHKLTHQNHEPKNVEDKKLDDYLKERIAYFSNNFEKVFLAQIKISAINTLLTAVYIVLILPMFGVNLPFKFTILLITFLAGLVPFGNLISNTLIFILSLSFSFFVAMASITYLVVIHKLEYFLNAKIIGSQIKSTAWELIIAMLFMGSLFGVGGIVLAPIYYAYINQELKHHKLIN